MPIPGPSCTRIGRRRPAGGRRTTKPSSKALGRLLKAPTTATSRVALVANGIDALVQVGDFHPHVVVLDVYMPELDGVEVLPPAQGQSQDPDDRRDRDPAARLTPEVEEAGPWRPGARVCLPKPLALDALVADARASSSSTLLSDPAELEGRRGWRTNEEIIEGAPNLGFARRSADPDRRRTAGPDRRRARRAPGRAPASRSCFGLPGGREIAPLHDALLDSSIPRDHDPPRERGDCSPPRPTAAQPAGSASWLVTSGPGVTKRADRSGLGPLRRACRSCLLAGEVAAVGVRQAGPAGGHLRPTSTWSAMATPISKLATRVNRSQRGAGDAAPARSTPPLTSRRGPRPGHPADGRHQPSRIRPPQIDSSIRLDKHPAGARP